MHTYDNPQEPWVTLDDERRTLTVALHHIPPFHGVEVRWLMPPELLTITGWGERLEEFVREEGVSWRLHWQNI